MQQVEHTSVGNRPFLQAVLRDLQEKFGYRGYKVTDTLAEVNRREGNREVVEYLMRKYNG
jgi:hypothetical protein